MEPRSQRPAIAEAMADIKLIDTHEHLVPESVRLETTLDFTYLLSHYLSDDVVSAGMDADDMESARVPVPSSVEGWERLAVEKPCGCRCMSKHRATAAGGAEGDLSNESSEE